MPEGPTSWALIDAPRKASRVHTTLKIMKRTNQAGPRWEPKNLDRRPRFFGASLIRMTTKMAKASTHMIAKRSSTKPNHGQLPTTGIWKLGQTSAPKASTTVNSRTMKPQNTMKCATPGTVHRSSLRCPATSASSARTAAPVSLVRPGSTGCPVLPSR